jgi:hypothetical protein
MARRLQEVGEFRQIKGIELTNGRSTASRRPVRKALELRPDDKDIFYLLGMSYTGEPPEKALENYLRLPVPRSSC